MGLVLLWINREIVQDEDLVLAGDFGAEDEDELLAQGGALEGGRHCISTFDFADELLFAAIDDMVEADVVGWVHSALAGDVEADGHGAVCEFDFAGAQGGFVAFVVEEEGVFPDLKGAFGACRGPGGAAFVGRGLIGVGEGLDPGQAVLCLIIKQSNADGVFFCGSIGRSDSGGDVVITGIDVTECVAEAGLVGGVNDPAIVQQLDFSGLAVVVGVHREGDVGGGLDFSEIERCDDAHPGIGVFEVHDLWAASIGEVTQDFGIELMPALEVEVPLHVSTDIVGVHDVGIELPLLDSDHELSAGFGLLLLLGEDGSAKFGGTVKREVCHGLEIAEIESQFLIAAGL